MYTQAQQERKKRILGYSFDDPTFSNGNGDAPPYWHVFKSCFPQCFNIFFTFFVTLTVFPAVLAEVDEADPDNFVVGKKYFSAVCCFLTFNLSACVGNLLPTVEMLKWVRKHRLHKITS